MTWGNEGGLQTRMAALQEYCMPQPLERQEQPSWSGCLDLFRASECSDVRDIYYSFAAMITPRVRIDYSLCPGEVFVKFAETLLAQGEWANVLQAAVTSHLQPATWYSNQDKMALGARFPDCIFGNSH